jgi:hypothetical protein
MNWESEVVANSIFGDILKQDDYFSNVPVPDPRISGSLGYASFFDQLNYVSVTFFGSGGLVEKNFAVNPLPLSCFFIYWLLLSMWDLIVMILFSK